MLLSGRWLRRASEFNLRYEEVLERFVEPWRSGRQVVANGRAFEPSTSKITIYSGVRLTTSQRDRRAVAVFYGRDMKAYEAIRGFLRDLDLRPVAWEDLVSATGSTNPYTGDVVFMAFREATAVIVLCTPDEEARLQRDLWTADEPATEHAYTERPRANVILEAGMALMNDEHHTIIVEIGRVTIPSNLGGRNAIRIGKTDVAEQLNALKSRLEDAGCAVNAKSASWLSTGRFESLGAHMRRAHQLPGTTPGMPAAAAAPRRLSNGIEDNLKRIAQVAAEDLLNRDDDPPAVAMQSWVSMSEATIRSDRGAVYASMFVAKGRGLPPRDEIHTKLAYILDDLVNKARGAQFG